MDILRVISGTAKGHKLKTLEGDATRPTTDRVKESLFNILQAYIADADVLDLFAGTGSLGIEALSRGARSAVFVDNNRACMGIINDNLVHTKLSQKAKVLNGHSEIMLEKLSAEGKKFDIIFLDPPYNKQFVQQTLNFADKSDIIKDDAIIVAEHDIDDQLPDVCGRLKLVRTNKYGNTALSFYRPVDE